MLNRRSFLTGLFAAAVVPTVKAADLETLCEEAQRRVNARLRYRTDAENFGVAQKVETVAQAYARGFGDCEEFALAYRHELLALGVPAEKIQIFWCRVNNGEAHAVCVVDGTYVVDCYLPNSVRTLARRPDLSSFRLFDGQDSEESLVAAIQMGRAAAGPR